MKTLDFVEVPKTFELCNRTECPMAGSCLRRRAWDALPPTVDKVTIVNPACTTAILVAILISSGGEAIAYALLRI